MKAVVWTDYGSPDNLQLKDVGKPDPKDDEILVRVKATSINSWDWELLSGKSIFNLGGRLKPKYEILGCDISGTVERVGKDVRRFHPGDDIFGDISRDNFGGFAEYVCCREKVLGQKSSKMSFEEAAAAPQASVLALQGLRDKGNIHENQKVLINGAGGGVGTVAIQIAKSYGAEVTGVDSSEKLDKCLSIGADHVIDYTKEDFTKKGKSYDLILDVKAQHSVFEYKRALNPKGICVLIGGSDSKIIQAIFLGSWVLGGKKVRLLLHKPKSSDLEFLNKLYEKEEIKPVIDRIFPLKKVPEAFRYYAKGSFVGNIVISI